MAKKKSKRNSDFKAAAANDDTAAPIKPKKSRAKSAVATGAQLHVLAGRPSKQAVIAVFGSVGYSYSWVTRAVKLGCSPEEITERFKTNPDQLANDWKAATEKKQLPETK